MVGVYSYDSGDGEPPWAIVDRSGITDPFVIAFLKLLFHNQEPVAVCTATVAIGFVDAARVLGYFPRPVAFLVKRASKAIWGVNPSSVYEPRMRRAEGWSTNPFPDLRKKTFMVLANVRRWRAVVENKCLGFRRHVDSCKGGRGCSTRLTTIQKGTQSVSHAPRV